VANRRASLPLNADALKAANEKLWSEFPELKRRKLTLSSADQRYRAFWMDSYLAALKPPAQDEAPPVPPQEVAVPCADPVKPGCGKSYDEYREQAKTLIASAGSGTLERNKAITKAYADMYSKDPSAFKWAGMAAFASCAVGRGMEKARAGQSGWKKVGGVVAGVDGKKLENALKTGNDAVYADIYLQHLAYHGCGIDDLQKAYDEGKIKDEVLDA
jgi:hypothetical protein